MLTKVRRRILPTIPPTLRKERAEDDDDSEDVTLFRRVRISVTREILRQDSIKDILVQENCVLGAFVKDYNSDEDEYVSETGLEAFVPNRGSFDQDPILVEVESRERRFVLISGESKPVSEYGEHKLVSEYFLGPDAPTPKPS